MGNIYIVHKVLDSDADEKEDNVLIDSLRNIF